MQTDQKIGVGIGVMLLRNGKVLLGKRSKDSGSALHGDETWTMPGGKLNFGESFEDGARRETMEETGIKIKEDLKVISVANNFVGDAHFVTVGLLCENFEGEAEVKEPDKITEWKWFELEKLPEPLFFPSKEILENYSRKDLAK